MPHESLVCLRRTEAEDAWAWPLQVSLPVAQVEGCPMGLGIIGPRGSDEALLDLAVDVMQKFA